jgi:hypothetical protein
MVNIYIISIEKSISMFSRCPICRRANVSSTKHIVFEIKEKNISDYLEEDEFNDYSVMRINIAKLIEENKRLKSKISNMNDEMKNVICDYEAKLKKKEIENVNNFSYLRKNFVSLRKIHWKAIIEL